MITWCDFKYGFNFLKDVSKMDANFSIFLHQSFASIKIDFFFFFWPFSSLSKINLIASFITDMYNIGFFNAGFWQNGWRSQIFLYLGEHHFTSVILFQFFCIFQDFIKFLVLVYQSMALIPHIFLRTKASWYNLFIFHNN